MSKQYLLIVATLLLLVLFVDYSDSIETNLYYPDMVSIANGIQNLCLDCINLKVDSNLLGIIIPAIFYVIFGSSWYYIHLVVLLSAFVYNWAKLFSNEKIPLLPLALVSSFFIVKSWYYI